MTNHLEKKCIVNNRVLIKTIFDKWRAARTIRFGGLKKPFKNWLAMNTKILELIGEAEDSDTTWKRCICKNCIQDCHKLVTHRSDFDKRFEEIITKARHADPETWTTSQIYEQCDAVVSPLYYSSNYLFVL